MKIEDIKRIDNAAAAQQAAIDWQAWAADQSLSYGELAEWADAFEELGDKFDLTDEFKENGIL